MEENNSQGALQAGKRAGRGSKAHGTCLLLPFGVEQKFGGAGQQNEISGDPPSKCSASLRKAGAVECGLHAIKAAGQEKRRYLQVQPVSNDDAETPFFWRTAATPG